MAFLTGSDETDRKEFTIFPTVFKDYQDLQKGTLIKVRGHVEKRLDEIQKEFDEALDRTLLKYGLRR